MPASDLRRRRGGGSDDAAATPPSRVRLDTRSGHLGLTVSNAALEGVRVDGAHPSDLAFKAGLRVGDVILTVDGASIIDHSEFVAKCDAAKERGAHVTLEYLTAAAAASIRPAPSQKSVLVAYLLWLVGGAGAVGLHHFYLGRDEHALLHLYSFGALGLGTLRDVFCMPRYVRAANEDARHRHALRAAKIAHPERPPRGVARTLGMLVFGWHFAFVFSCLPPRADEAPWTAGVGLAVETALQVVGATLAVVLVGSIVPHAGSPVAAFQGALLGLVGALLFFGSPGSLSITAGVSSS